MGPLSKKEQAWNVLKSSNVIILAEWQREIHSKSLDHQAITSKLC